MSTLFSKIINGQIPCYKIAENQQYFAFLDISPLAEGHTLVVPKQEVDYIFDLDDNTLAGLHVFSKQVAIAQRKAIPCIRIGTAVIGLEVPHVHIHLIPLNSMRDINFSLPKMSPTQEALAATAAKIREYLPTELL
jgi:histidine triad (HIT) family protein